MQETTQSQKLTPAAIRVLREDLGEKICLDPRAIRVCCGHAIEPCLSEIRDSVGPSLFVSVWRCPRCIVADCHELATASLDLHPLCLKHFYSTCYQRLNEIKHWLDGMSSRVTSAEMARHFLTECTRQASDLTPRIQGPHPLARERLLDILQRAADLSRRLRRSPRKVGSIPVRLRREEPERFWEEETETQVLSRHNRALRGAHARMNRAYQNTFETDEEAGAVLRN